MTKRNISYAGKSYSVNKRRRTLDSRVSTLTRQVNANKKELKYYDATLDNSVDDYTSLFTGMNVNKPVFIGRQVHLKRLHVSLPQSGAVLQIFRETKVTPVSSFPDPTLPLATRYDPEYQRSMRDWNNIRDSPAATNTGKEIVMSFGKQGRLVEFDTQTGGVAAGTITKGNIFLNSDENLIYVRVWYTDT